MSNKNGALCSRMFHLKLTYLFLYVKMVDVKFCAHAHKEV